MVKNYEFVHFHVTVLLKNFTNNHGIPTFDFLSVLGYTNPHILNSADIPHILKL